MTALQALETSGFLELTPEQAATGNLGLFDSDGLIRIAQKIPQASI